MTAAERREARDDLRTEIDEIDATIPGWLTEIEDLREEITAREIAVANLMDAIIAKRVTRRELVARRNALKPVKA